VHSLLGEPVVSATGHLRTYVHTRVGHDGPEPVTVDDAAWATLTTRSGAVASLEVSRVATGRKNGLTIEVYGSRGSLAFDLERLNELQVNGERVLVTEEDHPYVDAWWPPGHVLGWDSTFIGQAADFLAAIGSGSAPSPSFAEGLAVQRVLAAVEQSAAASGARVDVVHKEM
jgi:predicted dehydrogenase